MELPQPRPYGSTQGRKSTHDFLSLYSPGQLQDSRSSQGGSLKTHDFLQPLERVGTEDISKEENNSEPPMENIRPPAPPATTSIEHVLPDIPSGIGTYSISHISQRVPKPEGVFLTADTPPAQASSSNINDGNSNCSSYTGSGFTLWGESIVMNKGQTGKENNFAAKERHAVREVGVHAGGQWATSLERPSQSLSSHSFLNKAFSSVSSSQQSFSKKQSFMDMIKSAKSGQKDENEDDDEFVIKKEPPPHHKGNISIKVEDKGTDQSPNTPRSKHSATEQRRRIKINDRFQMLRGLIPNSDQKRDKASFLLEVVEYIQFLQEKVQRYEGPYQGWSQEPPKMMPWKNGHRTAETFGDQSGGTHCGSGSPLVFATKFDEANTNISSTMPRGGQDLLEYEISTADTMREMDHHRGLTSNGLALHVPLQQAMYSHKGNSSAAVQLPPRVASNTEIRTSQSHPQLWQSKPSTTDSTMVREKLKDQEMAIESGKISISSVYSQELLNTLTQSLQSSGVDLSQASISVQIDVANRKNRTLNPSTPIVQTDDPPNNQSMLQSRLTSGGGESEQAFKRLKTGRS